MFGERVGGGCGPVRRPHRAVRLSRVHQPARCVGYQAGRARLPMLAAGTRAREETTMRAPLVVAATAVAALVTGTAAAQEPLTFDSSLGEVAIFLLGHASLRIEVNDLVIHVGPWSHVVDYAVQPDAALVLVPHAHPDPSAPAALEQVAADGTAFVLDGVSAEQLGGEATALATGETYEFEGITITAV